MKFVQRCSRPCRSIVTDSQHCCVKSSDRRLRQTANNIKRGIKRDWYCRVFPRDNFDAFSLYFFLRCKISKLSDYILASVSGGGGTRLVFVGWKKYLLWPWRCWPSSRRRGGCNCACDRHRWSGSPQLVPRFPPES